MPTSNNTDLCLWQPTKTQRESSLLWHFLIKIQRHYDKKICDYTSLHRWSIKHPELFWRALWHWAGIKGHLGNKGLIDDYGPTQARWFEDSKLNFAENLLPQNHPEQTAIISCIEDDSDYGERQLTYAQLYQQVSLCSQYLLGKGIKPGDRVASLLPNVPETIVAMLATITIGAIWTSTSPDFGSESVIERFSQTSPKILFVSDAYRYKGQWHSQEEKIDHIRHALTSIEETVVLTFTHKPISRHKKLKTWQEILSRFSAKNIDFQTFAFNAPVLILYSSGTTGKPKCIVHRAGGILLQHIKEHRLHCDIKPGDTVFYYTNCGWMMWNWLVSALASGATLMLYDGHPLYPDANVLWHYAEQHHCSLFGCSAKYLLALEKAGFEAKKKHKLDKLKMICSTGSVLPPESFDYIYTSIKNDICLASISGGSDICSCFVLGNIISPVYRGQTQGPGLAMQVQVFNDRGEMVQQEKGELVCLNRLPCQPLEFWADEKHQRYHKTYFSQFPNVWMQGDWIEQTAEHGFILYGRSDATLNPGGIRIGTAEIYRHVDSLDEVFESVVVAQEYKNDCRLILFVQLNGDLKLNPALENTIRSNIKKHCSRHHVPALILQVDDIPHTRSGKIVELAIREIIHGRRVKNTAALANPESLQHIKHVFYAQRSNDPSPSQLMTHQ
ncbi:MAG: acetoacetate--CoA ligase [Pseudomonadales bacterium]|nr:acetoacetate--CoA ligase [Pseudomonadales bacterium]